MHHSPAHRYPLRLAAILGVLLSLLLISGRAVRADGEQPVNVSAMANSPGAVTIVWTHSGDGVFQFDLEEQSLGLVGVLPCPCGAGQQSFTFGSGQPNTPYWFRVCADYDATDTDRVCSDENGVGYTFVQTPRSQDPNTSPPPPTPVVTISGISNTSITVQWTASGHGYTKYFINYEQEAAPGAPRNHVYTNEDDHADDHGTWTITGLPAATTWLISVQGCDFGLFGDSCYDFSSPPTQATTSGRLGDEWRTRWQQLDANPGTTQLVAAGSNLYQLHSNGQIWRYTGKPCDQPTTCTGWQQLDANPGTTQLAAGGDNLYQLHANGEVWQYTGKPCDQPTVCTGWKLLDNNPATTAIQADGNNLYQLHNDGAIWKYTGTPKAWQELDDNPGTVQIAAGGGNLYQLHHNGEVWQYTGKPCDLTATCLGWKLLDNNPATTAIVAGDTVYQLHGGPGDGTIWQYTGTPMAWKLLDNNPQATAIAAAGGNLYQLHSNGEIWQYNGTPMVWQPRDDNPAAVAIAAGGADLYQLHNDGTVWKHTP